VNATPSGLAAPAEELALLRRLAREGSARPGHFARAAGAGTLWRVRAQLSQASAALARGELDEARAAGSGADAAALGVPGLAEWIVLSAGAPSAGDLLRFAAAQGLEPLGRAGLVAASRVARTADEREKVGAAIGEWRNRPNLTPRALTALGVSESRLLKDGSAVLAAVAAVAPDAPERYADLFDDPDVKRFDAAVKSAPAPTRIARARTLLRLRPKDSLALLAHLPTPLEPADRLALAELRIALGESREALVLLRQPLIDELPAEADRIVALGLSAEMQITAFAMRRGRADTDVADSLAGQLNEVLKRPLRERDRKLLLESATKLELAAGRRDAAKARLAKLVELDPTTTAAADDLFGEAFGHYLTGKNEKLAVAARLFAEQASLYHAVPLRRRATYWAARARARLGETDAARALYASLLPSSAADLYGRWAARELRVALPEPPPADPAREERDALSASTPGPMSRELLACGFPGLAEDAAEAEGSLDPPFRAAVLSERDDHRRAVGLLKGAYPELGTPDEGTVPVGARRAFYPLAESALLRQAALDYAVPPALVCGLIRQESVFQRSARSRAGALGLMQVMPATGFGLRRQEGGRGRPNLLDPAENIRLGTRYLSQMLRLFSGDQIAALAAYNAGPGRVRRWKREKQSLAPDEFFESIPLAEPRDYVRRVLFYQEAYAALYGADVKAEAPPRPASAVQSPRPSS